MKNILKNRICGLEGEKMFKHLIKKVKLSYLSAHEYNFDRVDPHLVRYFRIEYGNQWKEALTHHLYKKGAKNDKKAA